MSLFLVLLCVVVVTFLSLCSGKTTVSIDGVNFKINGKTTYENANINTVPGLLLNCRMIQGVFDDANKSTVHNWDYPDIKKWDPQRNTNEFVGNMSLWNSYGLLSFTVGLQGGGPGEGYPNPQPWIVSGFDFSTGALNMDFINRLDSILIEADKLSMVPIVQFFYWGQSSRFNKNNTAINISISNIIDYLISKEYTNLLIDVANECTSGHYAGTILHCSANMTLTIGNIKKYIKSKTGKTNAELGIYLSSSINPCPSNDLINISDFVLIHGNGDNTTKIQELIDQVKATDAYKSNPKPIVFNEDPNKGFNNPTNNFEIAIKNHCSWGFYDQGTNDYKDGYQSPPTDWEVNTNDKQDFFNKVKYYSNTQ